MQTDTEQKADLALPFEGKEDSGVRAVKSKATTPGHVPWSPPSPTQIAVSSWTRTPSLSHLPCPGSSVKATERGVAGDTGHGSDSTRKRTYVRRAPHTTTRIISMQGYGTGSVLDLSRTTRGLSKVYLSHAEQVHGNKQPVPPRLSTFPRGPRTTSPMFFLINGDDSADAHGCFGPLAAILLGTPSYGMDGDGECVGWWPEWK